MYYHLLKNPELARVVADITGDGHLQIQEWRYLVSFYSKETEEIEAVKMRFYNLFQIKGRVYLDNRKNVRYKLFFISKPVTVFLRDIGTPVGNKTNIPFSIPDWILNGSEEVKAAYLRGLFDSEGTIHCTRGKKPRWRISIEMAKNAKIVRQGELFLEQVRQLLLNFGIVSSPVRSFDLNVRKDNSKSICSKFDIELHSFSNTSLF